MAKAISQVMAVLAVPVWLLAAPARADDASAQTVVRNAVMVPTDELLERVPRPKIAAPRAPKRVAAKPEPDTLDWLYSYVDHALKTTGLVADAPPRRRAPVATRVAVAKPIAPADALPTETRLVPVAPNNPGLDTLAAPPLAPPKVAAPVIVAPTVQAAPKAADSPIVTGALAVPPPPARAPAPARPSIITPEAGQALIAAAEKAQAALDLVKLELSNRTYNEMSGSGSAIFRSRTDWRVLERATDALSQDELAAAKAVGFEANAYINEVTKTIVVAVAGSEDLRRDFVANDIWQALVKSQLPQQAFMAKTYARSVIQRYQRQGFITECVGHSLGGAACAYAASELGIRAITVNPIAGGRLDANAKFLITNYVVDGEIASIVYAKRGNEFAGDIVLIGAEQADRTREKLNEKYGPIAGAVLVVRELRDAIKNHRVGTALDKLAEHAGVQRPQ